MQFTFHPVPFWIITGYYLIINIVLFCAMALDKKRAIRGRRRVPEKTLFLMAILGGSIGGFVGMFTQHHKTKHISFYVAYGLTAAMHIFLCWLLMTTFAFIA